MSQLDVSIFYNHLFSLLLILYIFSHFSIIILSTFYYNIKLRELEDYNKNHKFKKISKVGILAKVLG